MTETELPCNETTFSSLSFQRESRATHGQLKGGKGVLSSLILRDNEGRHIYVPSLSPFVGVQLRLHIETASTAVSHVDVRRPHHQQHAGCDFAPRVWCARSVWRTEVVALCQSLIRYDREPEIDRVFLVRLRALLDRRPIRSRVNWSERRSRGGRSDGLIVGARRSGRIGSGVSPPHFLMVEKIQSQILKQYQHGR